MKAHIFFYTTDRMRPIRSYKVCDLTTQDCVKWAISEFFSEYPLIREFFMEVKIGN